MTEARAIRDDPLLTPSDVCHQCGLSLKTVYRAIGRGELRASKICSRLRVRQSDVDIWIERSQIEPHHIEQRSTRFSHPAANGLRALLPQMSERASP